MNVRISQMNACAYCLHIHVRDSLAAGETPQRLAVLPAWRETTLFTDTERAVLTLVETITALPDLHTQEHDYAEASRHLTPDQISAVGWVAIAMTAFNRVSVISQHPVRPEPDTSAQPSRDRPESEGATQ